MMHIPLTAGLATFQILVAPSGNDPDIQAYETQFRTCGGAIISVFSTFHYFQPLCVAEVHHE